jgi:hypothetical protein
MFNLKNTIADVSVSEYTFTKGCKTVSVGLYIDEKLYLYEGWFSIREFV